MAKIKPFKAVIYNRQKVADLSKVTCPPYDIISPASQQRYQDTSPYNLIHMLLGKDTPGEDKYARAGVYFNNWIKDKIFIQDEKPAIYFYLQEYNLKGERKKRMGFIGLLHLDDKNSSVYAHENTRAEAKEDRLKLIREVKANLSPIFAVFADKKRIIQYLYQHYARDEKPFIEITDDEKTVHKVWRLDDAGVLARIGASIQSENVFIADGHHRYEVGCAFREETRRRINTITGEEDFNYILAYFTNTDPIGLTILPIHRLVKLDKKLELNSFLFSLKDYFDVETVKDKARFFFLLEKAGRAEHVIGMYQAGRWWLLRLKNVRILDKLMCDKPKEYRVLDVSILNYIVLKKILGLDLTDKESVNFEPNAEILLEKSGSDPAYIAFFLNSVKVEQIMAVALAGEKMPPKSTYFYPKVLSGLVINKFEEKG